LALQLGVRLGPYEIVSALGAGGMGEVYKARDPRLDRIVAIKVLHADVASAPDRRQRFEREARAIAALQHPHICVLHDIGRQDGTDFLVMEYLDGETLARRLTKGPLPLDQALQYAIQVADALDKAHRQGITHRDLKPGNLMLTKSGVKLLDFGLAKLREGDAGPAGRLSALPTQEPDLTGEGTILGTLQYMAPEQLEGKKADARTDIFAFGAVVFEMVTGRKTFDGKSQASLIGAILKDEPPTMSTLQSLTPPALDRVVSTCLAKDPDDRWQTARDVARELGWIAETLNGLEPDQRVVRSAPRRRERLVWVSALALVTVMAAGMTMWALRPVPPAPEVRFEITTPPTPQPTSLAISPDGQKIVFVATSDARPRLWLRSLDSVSARPLAGTDGGFYPFWSPDNRSIGFFADGKLERIDLDGGLVRALANAPNPLGGSWNRDGTILFTPNYSGPIFRTSAAGGEAPALTRIEAQQASHRFPQFLPDGRHFLYYVSSSAEVRGVYVGELDGGTPRRLLDADAPGAYASSGHLLFVRQGTLIAQEFDPVRLVLIGNPFSIAEQVVVVGDSTSAGLSASAAGPLVYRAGLTSGQRQFIWFDRSGREIGKVGDPDSASPANPSPSPDGRRIAINRTVNRNTDVWILDLGRGSLSRFTFDPAADSGQAWSPDGSRIVFTSNRNGVYDLYQKSATGAGSEDLLLATAQNKSPMDWSPDGRFVLFRSPSPATGFDLWALPIGGERKPFPVVQSNFEERDGQFSPDGKWIAYQSNESGRMEIVVQPFPGPGGKLQVSTNGGAQVRWRADGKELFYIALDGRLMAVPIRLASNSQSVEADAPVPLFPTSVGGAVQGNPYPQQYAVSADGQRFLMNTIVGEAMTSPITVILNWKPKP